MASSQRTKIATVCGPRTRLVFMLGRSSRIRLASAFRRKLRSCPNGTGDL